MSLVPDETRNASGSQISAHNYFLGCEQQRLYWDATGSSWLFLQWGWIGAQKLEE